jgi:hypothetical protein
MNKNRFFSVPLWARLIVIPFIGILTFGILAKDLGYFWDDWAKTLVNVLFGLDGYKAYYASDRPLSGWTHVLFVSLIGNNQLLWQYLNLGLRMLAAFSMGWSFSLIWPKAKREVALVSVLYFVMPVFTQQPVAVTFHQQWLQACLYFLALGCIFLSIQKPKYFWLFTLIAVAANALQLTVTEYFLGMMLAIPFFIMVYMHENGKRGKALWLATLKASLPQLLLLVIYLAWRFNFMSLTNDDPYALTTLSNLLVNPIATLLNLAEISALDLLEVLVGSWAPVFDLAVSYTTSPMAIYSWLVSLASAIAIVVAFCFNSSSLEADNGRAWVKQFLLIGLVALIAGLLPAWATDRKLLTDFHSNRYALPGMFGAGFIIVACLSWFVQNWQRKVILVSVLAGLAAGYHVRVVNEYRWNWKNQTTFYWQLFWRAPALEKNTALFFEEEPFENQGLFSTSAAINLLYQHDAVTGNLPYWAYTILPRYNNIQDVPQNQTIQSRFRTLSFVGNTDQFIMLHYDPNHGSCWWALNEIDQDNPYISDQEKTWANAARLSSIQMPSQVDNPNETFFGAEPQHTWCYYYEKAELAVQYEAWDDAAALADEVLALGYQPEQSSANSPREWIPFIAAYTKINQLEKAFEITQENYLLDPKYQPMLCTLWNEISSTEENDLWKTKVDEALNCSSVEESIMINPTP